MIAFVSDDHYGAHPGRNGFEAVSGVYPEMIFTENDWSVFTRPGFPEQCELLILNMIAGTCGVPAPDAPQADAVRAYCQSGKPLLLLHGASAAFWPFAWWRRNCGLRWVRPEDPDGVEPSCHPIEPYRVTVSKVRSPLAARLCDMTLPEDEIYTRLEQTAPLLTLMETTLSAGTFPQCVESVNEWGGRVIGFLPGHRSAVTRNETYLANLKTLIDDLRAN